MELGITTYLSLSHSSLMMNGKTIFENKDDEDLIAFLKTIYSKRIGEYPKFHKMDVLSKVATILSCELVEQNILEQNTDKYAMVFANATSSKTVDMAFQASVAKKNPSPALFVYTLPNICIGEITIKNKWTGDSIFCLQKNLDFNFFKEQIMAMAVQNNNSHYICAWINEDNEKLDAFLFLVESTSEKTLTLPFNEDTLNNIYNSK
jgi:hypothetical protein